MSIRLKKLLALSLSVSLAVTGLFTAVGVRDAVAATSKTKQIKDKNAKKVKITVAQKKTIKAPKSDKKATWSILSGKQNISVIKKGKREIKIKAQKSGSVKLQAKQGKKKTTYNITVKKQAPKKSELKQLRKLYIDCFWKAQEESPYDWGWRKNSNLTKLKWFSDWVSWDDYGYVKGIALDDMSITTPYFIGYDIEADVKLPTFKRIQYFGSVTGNSLKSVDLGNNPTLKYFFLKQGYGEYYDEQEYAKLKEINVSGCKNLENFYIRMTYNVKKLDLSNNCKIKTINITDASLDELKMPKTDCLKEFYINWSKINELDLSNCTDMKKIGIMGCNSQSVTISLGNKTDKEISEFDIAIGSTEGEMSVRFVANREISEVPKVRYEYEYLGYIDGGLKFMKKCVKFVEKNGNIHVILL
ncbi:hypothetical protein KQI69_06465 [Eubacterium sp. MSJ-13]|uniref:hypothetical protein n=1 Tax=Eubacterium sp. MSJ-13 TaxID=2841513 RepID=UPI001C10392F|nr:hypothetical protein [Eubacterium sp. MSJ-13]MBU5478845.1 hypothetical protein [Eubacterium sp. MSJ-13]